MMTPEQTKEFEENLFVYGVAYFHKKEQRVINPTKIRRISSDDGFYEAEDWKSRTFLKNVRRYSDDELFYEMLVS
jgi:hypothetical protein